MGLTWGSLSMRLPLVFCLTALALADHPQPTGRRSTMQKPYSLVQDPIYFVMVGFFALLTTGLAAGLGQPRFLPISQTVALFAFLVIALRRQSVKPALLALSLWLAIQCVTLIAVTRIAPIQAERAIHNGFLYRTALVGWLYGADALPRSIAVEPVARCIEVAGVLLGSLFSGGLVGFWFLVRAANLVAYSAGVLWQDNGQILNVLAGLGPWALLRVAGYAGFVVLLAQPLLTGYWSPHYYWARQRTLILTSFLLVVLGLVLEFALPGLWRQLFV